MSKEEFLKVITRLSMAYNKNFDGSTVTLWYDYFKDCDYEMLKATVKRIILSNKYIPSIAELKEEYEKQNKDQYFIIINQMQNDGYFKDNREYEKTIKFINENTIPQWLKEEIIKYQTKQLDTTQTKLIGA